MLFQLLEYSFGALLLFVVAFFAYCVIPVVVMMASVLVILEADDELDVMKVMPISVLISCSARLPFG